MVQIFLKFTKQSLGSIAAVESKIISSGDLESQLGLGRMWFLDIFGGLLWINVFLATKFAIVRSNRTICVNG